MAQGDDTITVVTVNWYSTRHLRRLLPILMEKSVRPDRIRFTVIDNTNGEDEDLGPLMEQFPSEVVLHDPGPAKGSWAHASGLDRAMRLLNTDWTLITDPDVIVFQFGWDDLAISAVAGSDAAGFGAPYPGWKLGKYHDFPSPIFAFFPTAVLCDLGDSWVPFSTNAAMRGYHRVLRNIVRLGGIANRRRLLRRQRLFQFTRRVEQLTGVSAPDVGWRLAAEARRRQLSFALLDFHEPEWVSPTQGSLARLASTFEVFSWEGTPMLAHKYSSANRIWGGPGSADVDLWESLTQQYLSAIEGDSPP